RFEGEVHEHPSGRLDRYIEPFRARYPLADGALAPDSDALEAIPPRNVVDGLAVRRAGVEGGVPGGTGGLPGAGADRDAVLAVLQRLGYAVDAIADVLTAEGVHQLLQPTTPHPPATRHA